MHVVFRESHGLEETETPFDLAQDPADLVVLSFSDSDLGAFTAGYERARRAGFQPTVRLANIVALRHPVSVDTYAERTLSGAKAILVRLIGGETYWPYGLASLQDLARRNGMALAILPADGRPDPRLDALSTLPVSTLRRLQALCDEGGAVAAHAALAQLALAAGIYAAPVMGDKTVPQVGFYDPERGVIPASETAPKGGVLVTFYRSYLTSGDTAPVDALIHALRTEGFAAYGAFAASLKAPGVADWLAAHLSANPPVAVLNGSCHACRAARGRRAPFRRDRQPQEPRQAPHRPAVLTFCPPGRCGSHRRRGRARPALAPPCHHSGNRPKAGGDPVHLSGSPASAGPCCRP